MTNKIRIRKARKDLQSLDAKKRDAVRGELEALAAAEITDVVSWDERGKVTFKGSEDLDSRARKAVKRVKVTTRQHGQNIEIEMHDKIAPLRLLAKHHGLLEIDPNVNRPTLIGINLKGPDDETLDE